MILLADNILLLTLFEADLRRYFASQYSWLTVCDLFACLKSIQSPPPQEISFVHVFLCRPSPTAPTVMRTKALIRCSETQIPLYFGVTLFYAKHIQGTLSGGLPRHFVPRNDMLERNAFIRVFPQICFDYACGSAETYPYIFALYSSATPRSGISSVADGFHLAQQDFICRKANFIARTYAPGVGGRGSGAVGVLPRVLTFEATLLLHISYVTPKLAHLKYAEKSQTVRRPHLGVARCCPTATSERGRGWVGYLP